AWLISQAKMHLYMQAQKAISQISLEFLNSRPTTLYISEDNSSIRFQIPNVDADGNLKRIPAGDPFGDLSWGDGETFGNYISYRLNGSDLIRERLDSNFNVIATRIIARGVNRFFVSGTSIIQIQLTLQITHYLSIRLPTPITYTVSTLVNRRV
ncbi:MAG: hypothetical protein NC904_08820, partial [Candidatus Omnitrophica bacterium]|nr:hypothetical protein [Candidatus Omnitrophota bacterium]